MTIRTIVKVIASRDHANKQEIPTMVRSSLLTLAAIASVIATSLTPASASSLGPRHFGRASYQFSFANGHYGAYGHSGCFRNHIGYCQ
jgi:hypothetical protein